MKKTEHVTTAFQQLIAKGTVMMPGVPNAAMARQVEVIPARATDPRLEARQVGDRDEQPSVRFEPARDPLQRRARVVEVLEHVPQRDDLD